MSIGKVQLSSDDECRFNVGPCFQRKSVRYYQRGVFSDFKRPDSLVDTQDFGWVQGYRFNGLVSR